MFPKNKLARVNLGLILILLGGIVFIESGPESWLDSEKVFMAQLHNSLWNLDQAKYQWATEKNKPENAIPTFDDLTPYLGEWKNKIKKLKALGIDYKITSMETNQSDVATLTRGIRFRACICCFYRAGTTYCIHSGWTSPSSDASPMTLRILLTRFHGDFFLGAALVILLLVNAIIFTARVTTNLPKTQDAPAEQER